MSSLLSFSRLNTFDKCKRRYYFQYIQKLHKPPNKFMQAGLEFHKMAERFHKQLDMEQLLTSPEEYLTSFKNDNYDFNLFLDIELERFNVLGERTDLFKPLAIERKLIGEVAGHNFIGYVDRVDQYADGIAVLDYKTKYPSNLSELRRQLALYAELIEAIDGTEVEYLSAYFYKEGTGLSEPIKSRTRTALKDFIERTVHDIREEKEFPKCEKENLCRYCMYKKECKACTLNLAPPQERSPVKPLKSF